jgi:hypothetical protein
MQGNEAIKKVKHLVIKHGAEALEKIQAQIENTYDDTVSDMNEYAKMSAAFALMDAALDCIESCENLEFHGKICMLSTRHGIAIYLENARLRMDFVSKN